MDEKSRLLTRPVAHRGLWNENIAENSLSAYQNAVDNNYPIEIDLYATTDGEIMSFHDATLNRMTGEEGFIYDKSFKELRALKLKGSDETIPTFKEVLDLVNGKVPLLIELKNQPDNSYILKAVNMLKNYKGEFAIQAFDPLYLLKVKKLAPEFTRGILATAKYSADQPFIKRFIIKNMSLNFLVKPEFISYSHEDMPIKARKTKNKFVFAWTVTSKEEYERIKNCSDNIIFENFIPDID